MFKSKAQKAKMAQMVKDGKLEQSVYDEYEAATPADAVLPDRVKPKKEKPISAMKNLDDVRNYRKKKYGV